VPVAERPNVVMVIGCTVRRDQLTPYGGPAHTTPLLASLAAQGTRFTQFYVASAASLGLGIYAFTLPKCPPLGGGHKKSLVETMGLNAFKLFRSTKMALFFIFAMLLGAALQLTNAYGDTFSTILQKFGIYDLIAVKYPAIIMSISQISETLFILTIPFSSNGSG
jgi:NHS family xanthosine MFS transporter